MNAILERFTAGGWKYAVGAVLLLVIGWYVFLARGADVGATLVITPGDFGEQVSISGTVVAAKDVNLGFAANGRIAGTYAKVGDHVWAGSILAEIENGDLAAALSQKRAALAEKQANLASAEAGTRPEEVAVARAAVENAQASLVDSIKDAYTKSDDSVHNKADVIFDNPRTNPKLTFTTSSVLLKAAVEQDRAGIEAMFADWARLISTLANAAAATAADQAQAYLAKVTTLLADANNAINQGVSDSTITTATLSSYGTTVATARTTINAAAASLTNDKATLVSAEKSLALKQAGSTGEDLAAAQAAVKAAQADVENAQAALAKTRVVAPFDGIVTRMDAKVGEIVSPSTSEISMQSAGVFEVETFIPEVSIARVAVGNAATTTLDAYGSAVPFAAKVISVDPAETVKDGVPTYKTMLAFLSADPRIRSGMTANVLLQTGRLADAIVIPSGAVATKNGRSYVSVLADGEPVEREVMTGSTPALGQVEILSGLSAGEVILLSPVP